MDLSSRVLLFVCSIVVGTAAAEPTPGQTAPDGGTSRGMTLKSAVKVRADGEQGGMAIHWMAFNGNEAAVRDLIISGANINHRIKTGSTPLHLAAYNGHTGVARLLIEHGAKVNARTKAGITPLDWAQRNGHEKVTLLLIAHGAKRGKGRSSKADPALPVRASNTKDNPGPSFERRRAPYKPSVNGEFRIQLGAFGAEQAALDAWALLRKKHPGVLGSRELITEKVSVKQKIYHRVQVGPMSGADASAICDQLKQLDQACLVVNRGSS